MFHQLMSAVQRLQPGDKMNIMFNRGKPTWLQGQKGGQGGAGTSPNSGEGTAPPPGAQPATAVPQAPVGSPDDAAARQMLITRMQQMGVA